MDKNIIAIKQPYFIPYIGFWQEVNAVDTYVFFDDVNYINRGWINRNNILVGGNKKLITISLRDASQNKHINEIEIADDFVKFLKTIEMAYKKAPHFKETFELICNIVNYEDKNLARFIGNSIELIARYLGINTNFVYSSSIVKNEELKRQSKIIDICERLKATDYYDSMGATELYDKLTFQQHNINLAFVETPMVTYKQFNNNFIPYLSIIDTMMFLPKPHISEILNDIHLC